MVASVIVAEDDLDHQRLMTEVVTRLGHEVSVASDGQRGLELVAMRRPDLVLADVDMPHLTGLQMCQAIHADPELKHIPVVIVTALLLPTDPRIAEFGIQGLLRKPFSVRELAEVVETNLALQTPDPAPVPAENSPGDAPAAVDPGVGAGRADATRDPAFMEALVQSLDTGVLACDTSGRMVLFNHALRQFYGDEGAAVPVQQWPQQFVMRHPDGVPLTAEELPLSRALAGQHVSQAGLQAYDRTGRPAWFTVNARPIRKHDGTLLGAVAAVHDVTSQHWAAQYESCKDAVLRVLAEVPDPDAAARLVLHAVATTLGWPYMRLWLHDPLTDRLRPAAIFTAPGEEPVPVPHRMAYGQGLAGLCWQRGELMWVPDIHAPDSPMLRMVSEGSGYRAAGAVPVTSGNTITGVMTFFSHQRQEPEPALGILLTGVAGHLGAYLEHRRANNLATQLAVSVQEYIALVGHELRTPLTSIGAYTELIATEPDATTIGEVRDLLSVVTRNNDRLLDLIDQLLDLAALESGHAGLDRSGVNLTTVVADAVNTVMPLAEQHHIGIHTQLPTRLIVPGDAHRLHQAISNLLDNAVRYSTDRTDVTVTLNDDNVAAVLTITDTGPGVPTAEYPLLFRTLYRGSNARRTGTPGTGLGLPLTRAIVALHRGTLTVTPSDPHGTTATLRIPLSDPRADPAPATRHSG
ncbi:ATP-binding protein [Krasilnikovia sp. MM14-A1004]|uniref:ATP-binding protein n=1 Tax=Krasilnikovia sp. MM14-A1004 TaxID=3373541 RepID=UPI00399D26D5